VTGRWKKIHNLYFIYFTKYYCDDDDDDDDEDDDDDDNDADAETT
jgi:hypothetical protein